jgi:hypothetical protein
LAMPANLKPRLPADTARSRGQISLFAATASGSH